MASEFFGRQRECRFYTAGCGNKMAVSVTGPRAVNELGGPVIPGNTSRVDKLIPGDVPEENNTTHGRSWGGGHGNPPGLTLWTLYQASITRSEPRFQTSVMTCIAELYSTTVDCLSARKSRWGVRKTRTRLHVNNPLKHVTCVTVKRIKKWINAWIFGWKKGGLQKKWINESKKL